MKRFFGIFPGVLMVLLLVGILPVFAQTEAEKASMMKSLGKVFQTENFTLGKIKLGSGWAVVSYSGKSQNYDFSGLALLKKQGVNWEYVDFLSKDATTDVFLKNKVPESEWGVFLDAESIERNRPVLAFLHKEKPGYLFPGMRHAGDWALVEWIDTRMEWEGQVLLKKTGDAWTIVKMSNLLDRDLLIHFGVPASLADQLSSQ